jgi:uncharacterized YccA/Bax inhibitor family protein
MTAVTGSGSLIESSGNPALNSAAFERAKKDGGASASPMTKTDVYLRALFLMALFIVAAGFGWSQTEVFTVTIGDVTRQVASAPAATWCLLGVTFLLGIVGIFAYRAAAIVSILYVLCQGFVVGVVCRFYQLEFEGIIAQAVIVTLGIFLGMLLLYATGIIKVTRGFIAGIMAAIFGLMLSWMVIWLISLFDPRVAVLFWTNTPIGIGLAILVVILASLSLAVDFKFVELVSASGAPSYMAWYAAFGLVLGIVWLFMTILRLLALLRLSSR